MFDSSGEHWYSTVNNGTTCHVRTFVTSANVVSCSTVALTAGAARGLSYGGGGDRIVKRLIRRPNRAFLSAQPLKCVCLAYIAGLFFFTEVCILLDDDWNITRTGIAGLNFLTSIFSGELTEKN